MERYFAAGTAWFAATHFIEYLRPAHAGEALDVSTWISGWDGANCLRRYAVTRERKLVARGETLWTFVDLATGRARPVPDVVLQAFSAVPDDDEELRALNLARRDRRALRA
jgi:acyl-CoA thioester hydrolase